METILETQFMVYTRAFSLDYSWIYGHQDLKVQKNLESIFNSQISNQLLDDLAHRITLFFRFQKYFILLVANPSKRRDDVQRTIFDRAMFLWQPNQFLVYKDLILLSRLLIKESEKVYENLSNDIRSIKTDYEMRAIKFDSDKKSILAKPNEQFKDSTVVFSSEMQWKDIKERKLIAEFPNSFDFSDIVHLVGNLPLEETIAICHGLPIENRHPKEGGCIVSAIKPASNKISIYNNDLQTVGTATIEKLTVKEQKQLDPTTISAPDKTAEKKVSVIPNNAENSSIKNEKEELIILFNELADKLNPELDNDKAFIQKIKTLAERFSVGKKKQVTSLITQILYLLSPAETIIPIEIHVLWQNLFIEILLFQNSSLSDIKKSWDQRISLLNYMTFAATDELNPKNWESQFKRKSEQLRNLLSDSDS